MSGTIKTWGESKDNNDIHVGGFSIRTNGYYTNDEKIWIERDSGEGSQFSRKQFEDLIKRFYEENF